MPDILVIDDTPEILTANTSHFAALGYNVTAADTGAEAIARLNEKQYDCIVLDAPRPSDRRKREHRGERRKRDV